MTPAMERDLPANLSAERMVLGSLLSGDLALDSVSSLLEVDDFSLETHRRLMRCVVALGARGEAINGIMVAEELRTQAQLMAVGGFTYLAELQQESIPGNLDSYIRLIKDKSTLRKAINAGLMMVERCYMATEGAPEIIANAEAWLAKLSDSSQTNIRLQTPEAIMSNGANFFRPDQRENSIATPWPSLDQNLGGMKPKQLIVIAARTSVGKSVAAAQIAQHAAQLGRGTAIFSMEMDGSELLTRMVCARASVNSFKFQHGAVTNLERSAFQRAAVEISQIPLWIDDSTSCTLPAIQSAVRKLRALHKVDLVVIDYLGLMETTGRSENRVQEISALTRGLKRLAREFAIPFVVLSQLSRQSVQTANTEPELHHLRESGSIEQDADVVIFLHPLEDRTLDPGAPPLSTVDTRFILAKHRGGPKGKCTLKLQRYFTRFDDPRWIPEETGRLPYSDR